MTDSVWNLDFGVGTTDIERELIDLPQDFYLRFLAETPTPPQGTISVDVAISRADGTTDTHHLWSGMPYYYSYGRLVTVRVVCVFPAPNGSYKGSVTVGYQAAPWPS
jgi:hypothetical protein